MAEKHIHKLKRHSYKTGNAVYFCSLPDCNFKIGTALSFGKRVICWRCGEPFLMNEYSIRLAKPHCEKCHKPKFEDKISNHSTDDKISTIQPLVKELSLAQRLSKIVSSNSEQDEEDI